MRLVTYRSERGDRAGLLRDGSGDRRLGRAGRRRAPSVRELLEAGRLSELPSRRRHGDARGRGASSLAPVPDPDKIICIGLNYRAHAAEAGIDPPDSPTFFAKFRNALAAPGATVAAARRERQGRLRGRGRVRDRAPGARTSAEADALDHVAGYTLLNDLSARDLQFATPQWMPGKVFDGAGPLRPGDRHARRGRRRRTRSRSR